MVNDDSIQLLIPVLFGWLLGVATLEIPKIYDRWKYHHVKIMYYRLLKKKYSKSPRNEKPLGWTCHGGLEHGLHDIISNILEDCTGAYRDKNWELLDMLVRQAYELSKCKPVKKRSWQFWNIRKEEKRVYTSFYYCFRFFERFNSLYHVVDGDQDSIVEFLNSSEPINLEFKKKYTEFSSKSTRFGVLSQTISWGYELEDPKPDHLILYKPFFKHNKTLKKVRENFQNDPNPSKENFITSSRD